MVLQAPLALLASLAAQLCDVHAVGLGTEIAPAAAMDIAVARPAVAAVLQARAVVELRTDAATVGALVVGVGTEHLVPDFWLDETILAGREVAVLGQAPDRVALDLARAPVVFVERFAVGLEACHLVFGDERGLFVRGRGNEGADVITGQGESHLFWKRGQLLLGEEHLRLARLAEHLRLVLGDSCAGEQPDHRSHPSTLDEYLDLCIGIEDLLAERPAVAINLDLRRILEQGIAVGRADVEPDLLAVVFVHEAALSGHRRSRLIGSWASASANSSLIAHGRGWSSTAKPCIATRSCLM